MFKILTFPLRLALSLVLLPFVIPLYTALEHVLATVAAATETVKSTPQMYVADSNIFMDRPDSYTCRPHIDAHYLDNPNVSLIVNVAIFSEALGLRDPRGTQEQRLSALAHQGGAKLISAATALPPGAAAMLSKNFNQVDAYVLETALKYHAPVLTSNAISMRNQVMSNPIRMQRYGSVVIADACA